MKIYKTPEQGRVRQKDRRDAIKATGGDAYAALLEKERAARAAYRLRHPEVVRAERKRYEKSRPGYYKKALLVRVRRRGRARGLEATIRTSDLVWPTHCPVLGIELQYPSVAGRLGERAQANWPSLDRLDNTKGYVPGNVFVISFRANTLKGSATLEEIEKVAAYVRSRR